MRVKLKLLLLIMISLFLYGLPQLEAQPIALGQPVKGIELPVKVEMDDLLNMTVLENGLVKVNEVVKATATGYLVLKQQYPLTFLFKRFIEMDKADIELENLTVNFDDANRRVTASYVALGMTAKKMDKWVFSIEGDAKLTTRAGNTLVFSKTSPLPLGGKKNMVITVHLPESASDVSVTTEGGYTKIYYRLPSNGLSGNPVLIGILGILIALLVLNLVLKEGLLGLPKMLKKGKS